MKITVIGGSGLIGSKVVEKLRNKGHNVVAASPASGVNTITGEGIADAVAGAQVVVDVANAPSFEDRAVLEFFETSGRNLLGAEKAAGVKHHLALSIVGAERLPESGYMRAKLAQEKMIRESGIPYTILHSTQFFEFLSSIGQMAAKGDEIRLSPVRVQPIAADDVAGALAELALEPPRNAVVEVAGPKTGPLDGFVRIRLAAANDPRRVISDIHMRYFGAELDNRSLVPAGSALLGATPFEEWLSQNATRG
jgi:uncharacterized protein YbjT (DUF2867 family)